MSITSSIAEFAVQQSELPDDVVHECKRLLLNNLASSIAACGHPAVPSLTSLYRGSSEGTTAAILWSQERARPEHAALINSFQMELLDFTETHSGVYLHPTSLVAPAALAVGEVVNSSGRDVLRAFAIGLEVQLAVAESLQMSGYQRGLLLLSAGSGGAAIATGLLKGLSVRQLQDSLGVALASGPGFFENVGTLAHAFSVARACSDGLEAAEVAGVGIDSAPTVFEGRQGMLGAYGDETYERSLQVIGSLGTRWRLLETNYKRTPTETITQASVECLTEAVRKRGSAPRGIDDHLRVTVPTLVASIAQGRYERFGRPGSDIQARADLRYVMAATWLAGRFWLDQAQPATYTDADVLELRDRVELVADDSFGLHAARVTVSFADGTSDEAYTADFRGTKENPLSDEEVVSKFRQCALPHLSSAQVDQVVAGTLALDMYSHLREFLPLVTEKKRAL